MSRTASVLAGLLLLGIGFAAGWICRQPVEPTRPTELDRPWQNTDAGERGVAALRAALVCPDTLRVESFRLIPPTNPVAVEIQFTAESPSGSRHAALFLVDATGKPSGQFKGRPEATPKMVRNAPVYAVDDPHGLFRPVD